MLGKYLKYLSRDKFFVLSSTRTKKTVFITKYLHYYLKQVLNYGLMKWLQALRVVGLATCVFAYAGNRNKFRMFRELCQNIDVN